MKKINFLMLVVAFVLSMTSVEAANVDRKYDVTNLIRISNELGGSLKEDTTSYSIELNKNINRLSDFLKLNRQQSDDIFDVHKVVMKQFAGLNLIKSPEKKKMMFYSIINYWKQHSFDSFVGNVNMSDDYEIQDAKKAYRIYWGIVNQTLMNRGIVNRVDCSFNTDMNAAQHS